MKAFIAQLRAELGMTLRRGENLVLTIGIPLLLLVFFAKIKVSSTEGSHPIDTVAPGIIALAIMSTSMVSLGIATGFERSYGVLKRLGTTPLGRTRLLGAKVASVMVIEVLQVIAISALAMALGWHPTTSISLVVQAIAAGLLGSIAFGGIGLALAGRLRGELNLAAANGLYLVLLLIGGMVVPLASLPSPLRLLAEFLPAAALSSALHHGLGPSTACYAGSWLVLLAWAIVTPIVAATTFHFDGD